MLWYKINNNFLFIMLLLNHHWNINELLEYIDLIQEYQVYNYKLIHLKIYISNSSVSSGILFYSNVFSMSIGFPNLFQV